MTWHIVITPTALTMLQKIADRRVREQIIERIDGLKKDPDKQGKPLLAELSNYRSLRAVGQRYRILYQAKNREVTVVIVAVGIRKDGSKQDVYELAKKLVRLGLIQ